MSSYKTLNAYNSCSGLTYNNKGIPVPVKTNGSSGFYVVPSYDGISYDALSKDSSGVGYYNIKTAYGNGSENCNQTYLQSACGGGELLPPQKGSSFRCNVDKKECEPTDYIKDEILTGPLSERRYNGNPLLCKKDCNGDKESYSYRY